MKVMTLFSERYGYSKVSDALIKKDVPEAVANAISSAIDAVGDLIDEEDDISLNFNKASEQFKLFIWTHFLGNRKSQYQAFRLNREYDIEEFLISPVTPWYRKLDLVEFVLFYLKDRSKSAHDYFLNDLNWQFSRLHFGYTIVSDQVIERISEEEINSIESAISNQSSASEHLAHALELYSQRPEGDYTNSIKESISAIEFACRERTQANNLGDALKAFEKRGISLHPRLKAAFDQLYAYTNQHNTGIRHAMMDKSGTYEPGEEEALFFLVICSAFVNYLNAKW